MAKVVNKLAAIAFALAAVGCSDGAEPITRDCLTFWNEACDYSLKATDEDAAARLMAGPFKQLDKKREAIEKRIHDRLGDLDSEGKKELDDTILDNYDEINAVRKRINNCVARLDAVMAAGSGGTNMRAMRDWFSAKPIGQGAPRPGGAAPAARDFAAGLVPKRPDPPKTPKA
jgi:hypothetical protein